MQMKRTVNKLKFTFFLNISIVYACNWIASEDVLLWYMRCVCVCLPFAHVVDYISVLFAGNPRLQE